MVVLIIGGSGSGKSEYAENLAVQLSAGGKLLYIATMMPFGKETKQRIQRHQELRRDKGFETCEQYQSVGSVEVPQDSTVLLECVSNLLANEMYQEKDGLNRSCDPDVCGDIVDGIRKLYGQTENLVVVTNDVCSSGEDYDKDTVLYMEYMGTVNRGLAALADCVVEVVCGIPIQIKGNVAEAFIATLDE